MVAPEIDPSHLEMENLVQKITQLCFSSEFGSLRQELERLYRRSGNERPARQAFQDALYTLMVQEEVKQVKAKVLE